MVWNVVRIMAVQINANCAFRCFYQDVLERRLWALEMSMSSMVSEFNPCLQNMTDWVGFGERDAETRL